jgi:hypothetical protein
VAGCLQHRKRERTRNAPSKNEPEKISSSAQLYRDAERERKPGDQKWLFRSTKNKIQRKASPHQTGVNVKNWGTKEMPKYVIEREIPNAGGLSQDQIQAISQKSCGVLKNLGPQIQWVESFVTQDKIYCVYIAPNEAMVREHAKQGGFPANRVSEVKRMIDPTSAEA